MRESLQVLLLPHHLKLSWSMRLIVSCSWQWVSKHFEQAFRGEMTQVDRQHAVESHDNVWGMSSCGGDAWLD